MTIREIDPAQESVESKHRPNATTNFVLPPLKPTAAAPHSNNNTTSQPLRAKRKAMSISNQGHIINVDESLVPGPDRDQGASMQDSIAQLWEDRGMTTKQLRLTAVDSGRRCRTSTCTQSLPSDSSSSPSSSPNSATPQSAASNSTEHNTVSPPSTHVPGSNGSLVDEMDLDTHVSSPSTVSADMDVASLSDTLDVSILEEDLLVRQIRDLSSPPPPPPSLWQDSQQPLLSGSLDYKNNQTPTHQQLIKDARAGKRVDRKEQQLFTKLTPPVLPTELLIKVFEWLAGYQSDLCSAALVSIEWNLCATGQLYRYPEFANTIHWAMFIQTLCKNREDELKRPPSRRYRPPIITPTCLSPHLSDHPPILLAPEQMANFGARAQQPRRRDRLDRTLGEYIRGIDLSRRAVGASRLCSCRRPYGPPVAMKECSVCSRPGKGSRSKPVVGSTVRCATGEIYIIQDDNDDDDGSEIDDGDMGDLDYLTVRPSLAAMREGFRLGSQQTPNVCLGQSGQSGFNIAGFDPASNDNLSMLEWSELQLSSTTDFDRLIRPIAATRTKSATATATSPTATTTPTAAIPSSTTTATTVDPSLIALTRSRRLAANRLRGELRLTSQDAASKSAANKAPPSEGGGSGNRGKVVVEKDASSTRKPMMITVSSLIQMARHCPNLEWLCLASTALADDTLYLETGDYMSTLQPGPRTGLTNVQVTVMEGIGALGQSCPNLGRVWLVGCDWVTHREVLALTTSCRRLQMMDVRHCARLEGRLSRLYMIMEGQDNNDDESLDRAEDTDTDVENNVIRNERVATPLNFETAPTTVLLGANVSGRGVRDGAMDDLFYWVYVTGVVGSSGTSSTATATAVPTTSATTSTTATTSSSATASSSTTPTTYNSQAVNEILSLLSSVALAREAPTDPLAFREWFKAIQDYDLVSYQPLKRLKYRYPRGCRPGEQKINGGGIGGASSGSSITNSSGYNNTGAFFIANSSSRRIRREQRQQQDRFDSDSDSESDSDSSSGSGTINQQRQHQQHLGVFGSNSDSDSHDDDFVDGTTEENLAELDG